MNFEQPLQTGIFKRRYKRFFAEIEYENQIIVAHVPNTGSMKGCQTPDTPCLFSSNNDPKRKLKYTLQYVHSDNSWVGVNTGLPNSLVAEAFETSPLSHWQHYNSIQREVKISEKSRIDLVLWDSKVHNVKKWKPLSIKKPMHLIEIKNVTMAADSKALFPDAVTLRGQKHIDELISFSKQGFSTELLFVVQRQDCSSFSPADHIDPIYGQKLREAAKHGVKLSAIQTELVGKTQTCLTNKELPIEL